MAFPSAAFLRITYRYQPHRDYSQIAAALNAALLPIDDPQYTAIALLESGSTLAGLIAGLGARGGARDRIRERTDVGS